MAETIKTIPDSEYGPFEAAVGRLYAALKASRAAPNAPPKEQLREFALQGLQGLTQAFKPETFPATAKADKP